MIYEVTLRVLLSAASDRGPAVFADPSVLTVEASDLRAAADFALAQNPGAAFEGVSPADSGGEPAGG